MDNVYSLGSEGRPLSQKQYSEKHHRPAIAVLVILGVVVIIGLIYWALPKKSAVAPTSETTDRRADIAAILREASATPPSQQDIDRVRDALKDTSATLPLTERVSAIRNQMNNR